MAGNEQQQSRLKELIARGKEQGYLTFDDVNEALPSDVIQSEVMEEILSRLNSMEFDIIDASEVDRIEKIRNEKSEPVPEKSDAKLDILHLTARAMPAEWSCTAHAVDALDALTLQFDLPAPLGP